MEEILDGDSCGQKQVDLEEPSLGVMVADHNCGIQKWEQGLRYGFSHASSDLEAS